MERRRNAVRELKELEQVFRALAHPSRRRILVVLKARGGQMSAGDIANRFFCRWPTTSRHLKQLQEAGLVSVDRKGREWIYLLDRDRLQLVVGTWLHWFEEDLEEEKGTHEH